MKSVDDLLLNVLVLTIPIVLYHIFWLDQPSSISSRSSRGWIAFICSLGAFFCLTHPYFSFAGIDYSLHAIPLIVAFLYGGTAAGLLVLAFIAGYAYCSNSVDFVFMLAFIVLLAPFFLVFMRLSNWKQKAPKIMFPSLLALLSAIAFFCLSLLFGAETGLDGQLGFWIIGLVNCMVHTATMWTITFLIERMKENNALRLELQRAEKLNVLSELAASVAHEIRNPMTAARGFMQILSQSQVSEEKKQSYTTMVIEEIDRAQSIISDYLSFAKPQAEKMERLDASAAAVSLSHLMIPYASTRGVELQFQIEPALYIVANQEKLVQCLVNLTKNGIEAMPEGGVLQINGYRKQRHIVLEIKDHGVGMNAEQIEQLGTPFYSTKHKGTGLGTMVSYRIVKAFGGSVEVTSCPGKGTCFRILLPPC